MPGLAVELVDQLPPAIDKQIDFVKDIRPILRAKCYSCHAAEEQESGLRLDVGQHALEGGDSGAAIVPGKIMDSPLLFRISGLGDDQRMPPEDEGTPLTDQQVALVRTWIEQGAVWPEEADGKAGVAGSDHWAFQPIQVVEPLQVGSSDWVRNGIDTFVLAKLKREGIDPSPEADRATLIRRVFLDLIGLPPSPAEWSTWMSDPRSEWYAALVDQLLASPHYGERWGRHWLDLARYADSDGYEKDSGRPYAWRWRTWVINALNEDMPFDRFSTEQLAGDLLPDAGQETRVATGFHRNTLINREGGTDPEEDRVKRTVDRTNTIGKIWLGITVGCAQCHSHKYDPLSQREYYRLYSFFNSLVEPDIGAPLPDQLMDYEKAKTSFDNDHRPYVEAIHQYEQNQLESALQSWEATEVDRTPVWTILQPVSMDSEQGTTLEHLHDGSILASGKNPGREEAYKVTYKTDLKTITGVRIEALTHQRLPGGGPGRSIDGNFLLTDFQVSLASNNGSAPYRRLELDNARADFEPNGFQAKQAFDGSFSRGWSVPEQTGQSHVATFELKDPRIRDGETTLLVTFRFASTRLLYYNLGRFRISVTSATDKPLPLYGLTDRLVQTLSLPREERSALQQKELLAFYRRIDPRLIKLRSAAAEHQKQAPDDPALKTKAQVVAELDNRRQTHVLIRGDFLQPGDEVAPDVPAVLPPLKSRAEVPDRLDLARWLFEPANPLTARVTVNRIWHRYFGRGIVASLEDFGTQGEEPSHAELLDWLASQFRESHWSLKALHRLIVNSSTYRQSAAARPELAERDPYNAWLARQNRLRVDAEVLRDLALSASGLIKHRIGGPSVRPPQPDGVAMVGYANSVKWPVSQGDDKYRRGLYTFFQRTVPYPMLVTFDAPDSNLSCARRERSNTPLQALTVWNDPVFFECAQSLGKRIVDNIPASDDVDTTMEDRIRYAFRLCLSREPSEREIAVVRNLYSTQRELAETDAESTFQIIGSEQMPLERAADLAAWIIVGRTLMNLDEFVTRG